MQNISSFLLSVQSRKLLEDRKILHSSAPMTDVPEMVNAKFNSSLAIIIVALFFSILCGLGINALLRCRLLCRRWLMVSEPSHDVGVDNRTVYLSIQLLFKFLYLLPPSVIETQSLERASQIMNPTFRSSCYYPLHERRYGTTFTHFPRTLIVDMNFLPKKWLEKIIVDEFIDLSQLAESQTTPTTNAKYKLVVVGKDMPEHTFIYVTACKFKNHIYCEQFSSRNINKGSRWYKVDNTDILELVPISEVLRGTNNTFLIYEQEREPDLDPEPEQQQFRTQEKNKKKKEKRLPRSRR